MENLQNNITSKPWLSEKAQTVITDGMEFGKGSGTILKDNYAYTAQIVEFIDEKESYRIVGDCVRGDIVSKKI